jgi:SPASM domain peptide maturase of grasp-with-spasm system
LPEYDEKNVEKLMQKNFIINRLTIYSSPFNRVKNLKHSFVINTKENFTDNQCGVIEKENFTQNIYHITEALHHNTCLNRKLHIGKDGNVKNCPFSSKVFGNILSENIEQEVKSKSFQTYWNIKKDEIKVCKDCEFRYVCTDCRVFIKDKNDIYSQPAKCTYNPYVAKWAGEDGYITVEEWLKINKIQ